MKPSNLPYSLPKDTQSQLKQLREITLIPHNLLVGAGEIEVEALCYMIMYRHLNRVQRMNAMKAIHSVRKKALVGMIITRVLDTTYVNPQWGIWSLSNAELKADLKFHSQLSSVASVAGIGASVQSGKELLGKILQNKAMKRANWITLVIWGAIYFNIREQAKAQRELDNRSTLITSKYY
jgi:hypothetical protein